MKTDTQLKNDIIEELKWEGHGSFPQSTSATEFECQALRFSNGEHIMRRIRLKSSTPTFSGTDFVCRKTSVTTVI